MQKSAGGKVRFSKKCDSSSNKWVGIDMKGHFLPDLPLLSCEKGLGKGCCPDPPRSQLIECHGQGPEQ